MAKPVVEAEPDPKEDGDVIDQLNNMSDAQLMEKVGLASRLAEVKTDLKEAKGLEGKAREMVAERIEKMLTPQIHGGDIKYAVQDAKRATAPKGKTTPTSMVADSGRWD